MTDQIPCGNCGGSGVSSARPTATCQRCKGSASTRTHTGNGLLMLSIVLDLLADGACCASG